MYGKSTLGKGLGYGVNVTIKKYLSYIVVSSFTGWREPKWQDKTRKYTKYN